MSNLKDLRIKLGLTQEQIATHVGSSSVSISQIENGVKDPSFRKAQKIARAISHFGFPCSTDELFPYEEYKQAS